MARTYTISDLSREFSITPRTMRYYEDQGLLHPERDGQSRIYSAGDRVRLGLILRGKRVGFSLTEIREMLDLYKMGDNQVGQLQLTLNKCRERIALMNRQREDIDATIAELAGYCLQIEELLEQKQAGKKGQQDKKRRTMS
ncbi:MAG: MerR family DNA-binding transcriptional regulator [Sphingomonadales bacterium]